jgi:hypothetical protein
MLYMFLLHRSIHSRQMILFQSMNSLAMAVSSPLKQQETVLHASKTMISKVYDLLRVKCGKLKCYGKANSEYDIISSCDFEKGLR